MNIWVTSDTHFSHYNIIKYCNRPFTSIKEHDETLIDNWNFLVQPNDLVYHLGDVIFGSREHCIELLSRLNGKIFLISGNHDKCALRQEVRTRFIDVKQLHQIKYVLNNTTFELVLCHYAMRVWNKCHHGSLHCFGHSHGKLVGGRSSMDVGVDVNNFRPIHINKVIELLTDTDTAEYELTTSDSIYVEIEEK